MLRKTVAIVAHASIAAAAQDQPAAAESTSVAIKTLKQDSGAITSAQIEAQPNGRNPMELIRASEMHGQPISGGWITSQETLASAARAAVKDNVLLADSFNVNLPEGSKLKAVLSGTQAWNSKVVCDPTVLLDGDLVRVWFGGGDRAEPAENLNGQIGYATLKLTLTP